MKKKGEHFVTCGQMKVLERRADASGLSYYQMMENAGSGAAGLIMQSAAYWHAANKENSKVAAVSLGEANDFKYKATSDVSSKSKKQNFEGISSVSNAVDLSKYGDDFRKTAPQKIYIFCGKGNNGGDGFVVARIMHDKGYDITVILVDGEPKTDDAITNIKMLRDRNIRILDMNKNRRALMELDGAPDVIVDAIYGTGFRGKLEGNGLKAAIYINRYSRGEYGVPSIARVMVAALDIPSGMGGDMVDGKLLDTNSISAHFTITFHAKKPVHLQKFAAGYCGEIMVVDIGIDEEKLWEVEYI